MSNLIKKALKISAYLYGLSLPTAFLVGGAMYARPVKSPMSARALRENLAPEWDTDFLRRSREVKIPVEERVKLTASLFGTDASQTVILLHSSGGNRLEMLPYAYHLWRHNIGVVMLDRRAHGGSEGESQPLFLDETDDLSAVIDYLIEEQLVGTRSIGVIGLRDGATSALLAAAVDDRIDAVGAIEPARHARDFVSRALASGTHLPRLMVVPQSELMTRAMALFAGTDSSLADARPMLAQVDCPVFIATGTGPMEKADARAVTTSLLAARVEVFEGAAEHGDFDRLMDFFDRNL
jgi:pimeloyl-ACP methyl ester carboxylesterase